MRERHNRHRIRQILPKDLQLRRQCHDLLLADKSAHWWSRFWFSLLLHEPFALFIPAFGKDCAPATQIKTGHIIHLTIKDWRWIHYARRDFIPRKFSQLNGVLTGHQCGIPHVVLRGISHITGGENIGHAANLEILIDMETPLIVTRPVNCRVNALASTPAVHTTVEEAIWLPSLRVTPVSSIVAISAFRRHSIPNVDLARKTLRKASDTFTLEVQDWITERRSAQ